jgi:PAS domain S-box-containing protein
VSDPGASSTSTTAAHQNGPDAALFGSGLPSPAPLSPDLLDLASDAIIVRSVPEDRILFWSGGAERLYGWAREEAIGGNLRNLLKTEFPVNQSMEDLLFATKRWRGDLTQTRRDGARLLVESCQSLRKGGTGEAEVLEIDREIREPPPDRSGLEEDSARFRALAEGAQIGVWEVDASGRTRFANDQMAAMLGRTVKEMDAVTPLEACCQDDREVLDDRIAGALRGEEREQFEVRFRRPDGSEMWALGSLCATLGYGRTAAAALGLFIDITDHKHTVWSLEAKNGRLSRAVIESHHRIKNNLQALAAMVDLQVLSHPESVPASDVQRLGQYTRSLASLHDLMTLDLRAHGLGESISLQSAVERIVSVLQPLAQGRHVTARTEEIWLTQKQGSALALALTELIANAIKHAEGPISVIAGFRRGNVHIEVLDHGPGFPAGFEAHAASGTGLTLVEMAVRWDLRGHMSLRNRPNGGGRVVVEFPVET